MSSFGEDLKRERELRKISLREIAESTKINVRYLDALENNDFKRLPGGVFNKGFVRAFAQHIGVDEEVMVNAYLLEEQAQKNRTAASEGEPLRGNYGDRFTLAVESLDDPPPARDRKRLLLGLVAVLAVIVLLIVGWMWFRGDESDSVETGAPELTAPPTAPEAGIVEPQVDEIAIEKETEQPRETEQAVVTEEKPLPNTAPEANPDAGVLQVEITLARPTIGRLNCDNRQVELLDRLAAGVTLGFRCDRFLLIDADDGGALMISRNGSEPAPLAGNGVALRQHRLTPDGEAE